MEAYTCEFCGWPCLETEWYILAVPEPMGYRRALACRVCYFDLQADAMDDGTPIAKDDAYHHWSYD